MQADLEATLSAYGKLKTELTLILSQATFVIYHYAESAAPDQSVHLRRLNTLELPCLLISQCIPMCYGSVDCVAL